MKESLGLTETSINGLFERISQNEFPKNSIFNFVNSHTVYLFRNHKIFREHILKDKNYNFVDGFILSIILSFKFLKPVKRLKGPDFSDSFMKNEAILKGKRHLFIGNFSEEDIENIVEKYPLLKKTSCFYYGLPQLKKEKFDDSELVKKIKKIKTDYVWIAIGNPKQEILSNDLSEKVNVSFFFNVGAFFDYAKGNKKQSPTFFQSIGLEWFYRLITDFRHTWKKVKRSFMANKYLLKHTTLIK